MRHDVAADFVGLTKCVMPKRSPQAFLSSLMSTPMILSAPTIRAPWMTLSPMPPRPNTTTLAPGVDLGRVDHRADARRHAAADVADLVERRVGIDFATAISGSTVKFEKVEQPM